VVSNLVLISPGICQLGVWLVGVVAQGWCGEGMGLLHVDEFAASESSCSSCLITGLPCSF
jgi:hypothetical protein